MPRLLVCGAVNWDITIFVDNLPRQGEELKANRVVSVPGGKGGNTAVAAARILGKKQAGIIGMIGSDEIATMQREILLSEGVDVSCPIHHKELASGQAYVIVDQKGENMILTHRAANAALSKQILREETIATAVKSASMLVVIDPPIDAAYELAVSARKLGRSIILSPAMLVSHGLSKLKDLLQLADYIILNEQESRLLASADDGAEACEKLSTLLEGKTVITTLGSMGCIICSDGRRKAVPTMNPGLFGLTSVNTAGAGDTFQGAFASFKLEGLGDEEAAFLANVAATLKITREQTRGSPTLEEIKKYAESALLRPVYDAIRLSSGDQGQAD